MLSSSLRVAVSLVLLPVLSGCDLITDPHGDLQEEVRENRALWESQRPVHYRYTLEHTCFCGAEARGPVVVEVQGSAIVSQVYVEGVEGVEAGDTVSADLASAFPSVDGLFVILADAADSNADQVDATFNPETGVPLDFFIDYSDRIADEEQGYRVLDGPTAVSGG